MNEGTLFAKITQHTGLGFFKNDRYNMITIFISFSLRTVPADFDIRRFMIKNRMHKGFPTFVQCNTCHSVPSSLKNKVTLLCCELYCAFSAYVTYR
jgi:hypothetical protein